MSTKMNHDDRHAVINHLAQALQIVAQAMEQAVDGGREDTERAIKDAYFGLDQSLHIVRGRPTGDPAEHPLSEYITPDVPPGFDTVLGWIAKHNPARIDQFFNPVEDSKRDGFALTARCKRAGLRTPKVPAPAALQEYGVTEVNAYPVDWLEERCG